MNEKTPSHHGTNKVHNWTDSHALDLLQLQTVDRISDHAQVKFTDDNQNRESTSVTSEFNTNIGREPYPWQIEALEKWENAGYKGIVKVVTGAGKTVMAMAAIQHLFRLDPTLKVSIIVPKVALMYQWYEEFEKHSNISLSLIGRDWGGDKKDFDQETRVVIRVINSAIKSLPGLSIDGEHFLIVDECHGTSSKEFRKIYDVERKYSLGLSATPEQTYDNSYQDEDIDLSEDASLNKIKNYLNPKIRDEMGDVIYELTFIQAVEEGIIPKFQVINYAVNFTSKERAKYDSISRQIIELHRELSRSVELLGSENQYSAIRELATGSQNPGLRRKAKKYEQLLNDRKKILYTARNRRDCLISILKQEINNGSQIIIFHETIEQINDLFIRLRSKFDVVLYHSQLPDSIREEALRLYANGTARIMLSARALIEGYNVPSTDVGIIGASSSSSRQRIQTMGRVMRKGPGKDSSTIYNIYVNDSVDENIFRKQSWEDLIGQDAISYHRWHGPENIEILSGPPAKPPLPDSEIDVSSLSEGDIYPGAYEGIDFSIDSQGHILRTNISGKPEYTENPRSLGISIMSVKDDSAGRFKITRRKNHVIVRKPDITGNWNTYFVRKLDLPLAFINDTRTLDGATEYTYSKRFGGCIEKRTSDGRYFDKSSPGAQEIISALKSIPQKFGFPTPNKFYISGNGKTVLVRDADSNIKSMATLGGEYKFEIDTD